MRQWNIKGKMIFPQEKAILNQLNPGDLFVKSNDRHTLYTVVDSTPNERYTQASYIHPASGKIRCIANRIEVIRVDIL